MRLKISLLVFLLITILPLTYAIDSAEENQIFKQNEAANLKLVCEDGVNSGLCGAGTNCNITIIYPNGTAFIDQQEMTNNGYYLSYALTSAQTKPLGTYKSITECASGIQKGSLSFSFLVTTTGDNQGIGSDTWRLAIVIIILIVAGLFAFAGYSFDPSRWVIKSSLFIGSLLAAVVAVGIGITYAVDPNVSKLMTGALVLIIAVVTITITALLIYYFKAIVKAVKDVKKDKEESLS